MSKSAPRTGPTMADVQMFDAAGNSPEVWALKAFELLAAANLCHRRDEKLARKRLQRQRFYPDVAPFVGLMLYAFAMEAILKALLLAQGMKAAAQGKLQKAFLTHDLEKLWTGAKLRALNSDEVFLLGFIRSYIEIGRYPVHTQAKQAENRVVRADQLKGAILALFATADQATRKLRPSIRRFIGAPSLATRGLRSIRIL